MIQRKFTREMFWLAVQESSSIREVLIKLQLSPRGGNYAAFHRAAKEFDINVSHLSSKLDSSDKDKRKLISNQDIITATKDHFSYRAVLKYFNLNPSTNANKQWIKNKILELNIDCQHFTGQGHLKNKTHQCNRKFPLRVLLVNKSSCTNSYRLKLLLIKEGILIDQCNICHITNWLDNKLSLHLDHIDGNHANNEITNLRLLCPNCHSLTPTYCRRKSSL